MDGDKGPGLMLTLGLGGSWVGGGGAQGGAGSWAGGAGPGWERGSHARGSDVTASASVPAKHAQNTSFTFCLVS